LTKKAYASRDTLSMKHIDNKLAKVEKEIERYLSQLNENDAIENYFFKKYVSHLTKSLSKCIFAGH